jgi:hypothetical protein
MGTTEPITYEDPPRTGTVAALAAGGPGTSIEAEKYWAVREAILKAVPVSDCGFAFRSLAREVEQRLPGGKLPGGGAVSRYVTAVRLDLETRGLIETVPGSGPRRLRRDEGPPTIR